MLLFFAGGGAATVAPTYPTIIFLTSGRLAMHLGGTTYMEL